MFSVCATHVRVACTSSQGPRVSGLPTQMHVAGRSMDARLDARSAVLGTRVTRGRGLLAGSLSRTRCERLPRGACGAARAVLSGMWLRAPNAGQKPPPPHDARAVLWLRELAVVVLSRAKCRQAIHFWTACR